MGGLRKGESVLIHNAGGGVGLAALDIAKKDWGGPTYGTASPGKHEFLRQRGLDHPNRLSQSGLVASAEAE